MGLWRNTKYFFRRINRIKKLEKQESSVQTEDLMADQCNFPLYEQPKVSIIIPFYNQEKYTRNCLKSISKSLPKCSFEIILVDDSSPEKINLSDIENIKVIRNDENLGFLKSVNKAILHSKAEFVYLLNNDTLVYDGFLDELLHVFENFENVGAVGSKLLNADGSLQEAGSVFMKDFRISQVVGKKKHFFPEFNYIYKVDYCSGCSLMFRRKHDDGSDAIFDEDFAPAYFEETDFCFQLKYQFGKDVYYTPFSKVVHFNGVSYNSQAEVSAKKEQLFEKNKEIFRSKWQKQLDEIQAEKTQDRILELNNNNSIVFYNGIVPEYDKNSGELRLTEIIKAYKKLNYFVAIIADKNKIDFRYNDYFQRLGVCVYYEHLPFEDKSKFLKRLRLKKPTSWFYAVKIFLKHYSEAKTVNPDTLLVYDMVDIHHVRIKRELDFSPKSLKLKNRFRKYLRRETLAAQKADIVVAISKDEEKYMQNIISSEKIITLSNIHYAKKKIEEVPDFHARAGILFVGSIHPPNFDAVNFISNEIMPEVWKKLPDLTLNIVGNVIEMMKPVPHPNIIFHGYVSEMTSHLLENRIMVAPLRYGAGVKGKIGQALEFQLPVVSTSIGAEGMQLVDGENALLADDPKLFADKIVELYTNETLWKKIQSKSEESLSPFSLDTLKNRILQIEARKK